MRSISSTRVVSGLVAATIIMPFMASAQTTDLQSQIQALMSQIQGLQQQLKTLVSTAASSGMPWKQGSSTREWMDGGMPPGQMGKGACITLSRNLKVGAQGDDVKKLQEMLKGDEGNGFTGNATGVFGPLTAKAMKRFQMRMGIASSTDGAIGPMTRNFFERNCGNGEGKQNQDSMRGGGGDQKPNGDMMRGGTLGGTISANNGTSIVIQSKDGKSIVVNITASTVITIFNASSTPSTGSASDLTVGKMAGVEGTKNADGSSIDAKNIRVGFPPPRPMMGGDDRGGGMKPNGMMPTMYGPQGGNGDGHGGPQN